MTEADAIKFYRGLLKLCPHLLDRPPTARVATMSRVFELLFALVPTRDHIRIAVAQHQGNSVKRRWDLKQQYAIVMFLTQPARTYAEVQQTLKALFGQRTRIGVIKSCEAEALRMALKETPETRATYVRAVREAFAKRSKEANVLG